MEAAWREVRTREIDDRRLAGGDGSGAAVGADLFVSRGVNLDGLPEAERIVAAMRSFPRIAP